MASEECKYGSSCYRRNVQHFVEFAHPHVEEIARKINSGLIEEVISCNLDPKVLEQAQLVSELIANGEMVTVSARKGIKRPRSPDPEIIFEKASTSANSIETVYSESGSSCNEVDGCKKLKANNSVVLENSMDMPTTQNKFLFPKLQTMAEKIEAANPLRYFLSTVTSVPETKVDALSLSFSDLLDPSLGKLKESVQFNFMVEFGWLLAQYCQHKVQRKPLLIVYGAETEEMIEAPNLVPTVQVARVKPKYPFGSHHTKMAILQYEDDSLRVIVHTGNLIESDWEDRTQGIWVSPSCPVLIGLSQPTSGESPTYFKSDFIKYLESYALEVLNPWIEKIRNADMSSINVCFVSSTPGSHPSQQNKFSPIWGHVKLAAELQQNATRDKYSSLVIQCSSIGSLGPTQSSWLVGELAQSMGRASIPTQDFASSAVQVIYPSYENVKTSIHGLAGGGCLPYSHQGHSKQLWFSAFLHHWKSDARLRSRAMPHIKSYTCVSQDLLRAFWFLLTSANLSKAAWGMRTNKGNSLMIQSFEAGVLFLPKFVVEKEAFIVGEDLHLPYDLPLIKYGIKDQPWFIDQLRR